MSFSAGIWTATIEGTRRNVEKAKEYLNMLLEVSRILWLTLVIGPNQQVQEAADPLHNVQVLQEQRHIAEGQPYMGSF